MFLEIATQPWGVVQDRQGNVRPSLSFTITTTTGTPVTRYTNSTGTTPDTSTFTNANGEIPGFIAPGEYTVTVGGITHQVEAVTSGTTTNFVDAGGTAWQPNTFYTAGTVVSQSGSLWTAKIDFTSGATFDATNWNAINVSGSAQPVFTVKDPAYGAKGDNTTDDRPAFEAAMAAAVAAGGGIIYIPPSTASYAFKSIGGRQGVAIANNLSGRITVRGNGRGGASKIRLTDSCKTAFGNATVATGDTFRNVTIEDFSVDGGGTSVTGGSSTGMILDVAGGSFNVQDIAIRNVALTNGGPTTSMRRGINVNVNVTSLSGERFDANVSKYSMTNILAENVDLGWDGTGGGGSGITVIAFASGNTFSDSTNFFHATRLPAPVFTDHVTIRRCRWRSLTDPNSTSTVTSSGFQVGGDGWAGRVVLEQCHARGAGDVCFELDSVMDLTIANCTAQQGTNVGFFIANNHGGLLNPAQQTTRIVNCTAIQTGGGVANFAGFSAQSYHGSSFGHLIFENCTVRNTAPDLGGSAAPTPPFSVFGAFRRLSLINPTVVWDALNFSASATTTTAGVRVGQSGLPSTVEISNLHVEVNGQASGTGSLTIDPLHLQFASKCHVRVDGVHYRSNFATSGGYTLAMRGVQISGGGSLSDDLTKTTTLANDFVFDAGSITDLQANNGNWSSVANHSTRKLWRWILTSTINTKNQIMRQQDAYSYIRSHVASDHSGELISRVKVSEDGLSELRAIVDIDPAVLTLYKVVNGVATSLGTAATPDINGGDNIGLRLAVQGDTVVADYFATNTVPTPTTTPTTTVTYTLTSGESVLFGKDSLPGYIGAGWTPGLSDATITTLRWDRRSVWSGWVRNVTGMGHEKPINLDQGVVVNSASSILRLENLRVHFRRASCKNASSTADVSGPDSTQELNLLVERGSVWVTPPVAASVTPTTGAFDYQNTDMVDELVTVNGGTVTLIELSLDGSAYTTVGTTAGAFLVPHTAHLRVTNSVVPTVSKIPLLN